MQRNNKTLSCLSCCGSVTISRFRSERKNTLCSWCVDGLVFLANTLTAEHSRQYLAGLAIIDREQESLKEKMEVAGLQQETLKRQIVDLRAVGADLISEPPNPPG